MATNTAQPFSYIGGATPAASNIGSELLITGNVISNGEVRLDGQVQGEIECALLVLGENSQLEGTAIADEVVVGGRLIGSVRAVRLRLQASSHVEGNLLCQSLEIEQGAYFDGHSRPSDNPLSLHHAGPVAQQPRQHNDKRATAVAPAFPEDIGSRSEVSIRLEQNE